MLGAWIIFILVRWNKYPKEQRGERNCQFIVVSTAIVITVRFAEQSKCLIERPCFTRLLLLLLLGFCAGHVLGGQLRRLGCPYGRSDLRHGDWACRVRGRLRRVLLQGKQHAGAFACCSWRSFLAAQAIIRIIISLGIVLLYIASLAYFYLVVEPPRSLLDI